MFSDQTLKLAVSNKHLVITWRQSLWIHRHIIALSFSRFNTVILKFISDLPQVAENSSAASATTGLPTINSSIGTPAAESTSLGDAEGMFRIIKKGKAGLRRLFEMFLSFPILAEAPIPLSEILDEPSLEEPSIRETEPAAHEVTYEIVEEGSRQPHQKIPRVFQRLRVEATTEPLKELVEYIQANWVYSTTFRPENWSVYGQPVRTNNDVEGWHNALNRRASGRSEIPFYQLIELLRMAAQLVELQMQLVADQKLSRIQRKKYRNHQKKIFNLWGQSTSC